MKKVWLAIFSALLLAGCATATQSNSEYGSDDITFAEMMIPHHEQAVEMSEIAFLKTSNPEVLQIAQEIKDAQSPEIELMKSWLGDKESAHSGHMMDGVLNEDEMSDLRAASGAEFDRLFLQEMIKHHKGAIEMAEDVAASKNKAVADLSVSIIAAQKLEIEKMKELLLKQ